MNGRGNPGYVLPFDRYEIVTLQLVLNSVEKYEAI